MALVLDIFLIFFCFGLFALSHTLLASNTSKSFVAGKYPAFIPFYRLGFNIVALFLFFLYFVVAPKPDVIIYDLMPPYDLITLIPQFISLAGLIFTVRQFDLKEFTGYGQINRWRNHSYDNTELDGHKTLYINGPYRYCRHPLYLFTIIFLASRPYMTLFYLITLIASTAYFYIGSFYEEKKLLETFGSQYSDYRKKVGRILPFKLRT